MSRTKIYGEAKSAHLLIRQPEISFQGSCTLKSFHALGDFQVPRRYDTKEFYGDDVSFEGRLKFVVDYSDTFTIVHDFVFNGNYNIGRPLEPYVDAEMFNTIFPYALVFLIMLFVISVYQKIQMNRKKVLQGIPHHQMHVHLYVRDDLNRKRPTNR